MLSLFLVKALSLKRSCFRTLPTERIRVWEGKRLPRKTLNVRLRPEIAAVDIGRRAARLQATDVNQPDAVGEMSKDVAVNCDIV
jgi:hypothetical protein